MVTRKQRHRILIVDDDVDVVDPLRFYFDQRGYAVETAQNFANGREAANRVLPSVVIVGTQLEDAQGIDLLRWLRERPRTARLPVMFIAPIDEADVQHDVLQAGADDFVIKPFDVEIVELRVRNAIARTERDGLTDPRSGLPTGRLLQERVQRLVQEDDWAKLEIVIRAFDVFRERYDFIAADEVLSFTAKLLTEISEELGYEDDFIAHREDEHFVIVTRKDAGVEMTEALAARFDDEVKMFYNFMDREQGYVMLEDENEQAVQAPLMTLDVKLQQAEDE